MLRARTIWISTAIGCRLNMDRFGRPNRRHRTGLLTAMGNGLGSPTMAGRGSITRLGDGPLTTTGVGSGMAAMVGAGGLAQWDLLTSGVRLLWASLVGEA